MKRYIYELTGRIEVEADNEDEAVILMLEYFGEYGLNDDYSYQLVYEGEGYDDRHLAKEGA